MVPEGWAKIRLDRHAKHITSGSRGWAEYYSDEGDVFVRITNLRRSSIKPDWSKTKYVALPEGMNEGLRNRLTCGDILISITADLGIIGFIPDDPDVPHYINQHVALVRLNRNHIDPEFVAYSLSSNEMRHAIQRLNDAGAKAGLSLPTIRSVPIMVPSLPEQRKIADILSTWDQAIEKAEALLSNAHTQKRALMQQLLTGKRRFPAYQSQPWKEVKLGDVCKLQTGPFGSQLKANEYSSTQEGVAVVMPKALIGGVVVFADCDFISEDRAVYLKKHRVAAGDVLFSRRGDVARTALVTDDHQPAICGTGCLKASPTSASIGRFLAILFQSEACRNWLVDNAVGQTMLNLNTKIIAALPIRLPCEAEQAMIVSVLEASDADIVEHEALVIQLRTEKKALMQQLLTGNRRVVV
jgi:type I restriction enzyme S subunit